MYANLAAHRLVHQQLVGPTAADASAVVGHFGAVQSQEHGWAPWSLGRRSGATLTEVTQAFDEGAFVRTHVLRPTWHYVLLDDLPDLLSVSTERVRRLMATHVRGMGVDFSVIEESADIAVEVVRAASEPPTRPEVSAALDARGHLQQRDLLPHILMEAEISGRLVNGPLRGKQHTYRAVELPASSKSADEVLAWVARTYGRGHGPFTDRDLAWWSSLTLTQARRAIAVADLKQVAYDGEDYVVVDEFTPVAPPRALLLANFDEYISYFRRPEHRASLGPHYERIMRSGGLLFIHGGLGGWWTRTVRSDVVDITVHPLDPTDAETRAAIIAEGDRFGQFHELAAAVTIQR